MVLLLILTFLPETFIKCVSQTDDVSNTHLGEGIVVMTAQIDEEDKWICPNCGEKMQRAPDTAENIFVCSQCGCSIIGSDQNLNADLTCPNCNQILDGEECPHCGYDLGSDFD